MVNVVPYVYRKTSGPHYACCSYGLKCDLFYDFWTSFLQR